MRKEDVSKVEDVVEPDERDEDLEEEEGVGVDGVCVGVAVGANVILFSMASQLHSAKNNEKQLVKACSEGNYISK